MKYFPSILIVLLIVAAGVRAREGSDFYARHDFLYASPGAWNYGLIGFANPAGPAGLKAAEHRFYWSTEGVDALSFDNWGYFFSLPHLGFGTQSIEFGDFEVNDYRLGVAFGDDRQMLGVAYGWSTGDKAAAERRNMLTLGSITRPLRYLSIGLIGSLSLEDNWHEATAEIGLRPLGTHHLTFFADASMERGLEIEEIPWSAGAVVELIDGVSLTGRYFDGDHFNLGLVLNLGHIGLGSQSHFDSGGDHLRYTHHLRAGGLMPSLVYSATQKRNRYLPLNLRGDVEYQKYVFFDSRSHRLIDVLRNIRAAADDPRIEAITLNLSGTDMKAEYAWEIREELLRARRAGKTVFAFIDRPFLTDYHLASVADKVILDPDGGLVLLGYGMHRTYFKGTLDKIGIGFEELRYFEYKSAYENYARDSMSDPDREQRQKIVDDNYEMVRADICRARSLTEDAFDRIIDEGIYINARRAVELGLVDTLARWSSINGIINRTLSNAVSSLPPSQLFIHSLPSRQWGGKPKIAVVYGLGVCDLDRGINARRLERLFRRIKSDNSIKAVVFRVDSPGGDALAANIAADAVRDCARRKPVVVSQGRVAASGGYMLSVYGDSILAGPNTITGSIGVIGGWLYDKGLGDKLGMTADGVQRGRHADLGRSLYSPLPLPFFGFQIPARNLTDEELEEAEIEIRIEYDKFVAGVAEGRGRPTEEIESLAQGRVYTGRTAHEIGLVDKIGGLMEAIAMARRMAGLEADREIEIVEYPRYKGLFNLNLNVSPFGFSLEDNPYYMYLEILSTSRGRPLPLLPPDYYLRLDE